MINSVVYSVYVLIFSRFYFYLLKHFQVNYYASLTEYSYIFFNIKLISCAYFVAHLCCFSEALNACNLCIYAPF